MQIFNEVPTCSSVLRNLLESPLSDWGRSPSPAADDFPSSSGDSASARVLLDAVAAAAAAADGFVAGAPPIAPDADGPRSLPAAAAASAALLGDVALQQYSLILSLNALNSAWLGTRLIEEVQLDLTLEIEVFHILFERCHTKNRKISVKQHLKYFNFRS